MLLAYDHLITTVVYLVRSRMSTDAHPASNLSKIPVLHSLAQMREAFGWNRDMKSAAGTAAARLSRLVAAEDEDAADLVDQKA